MKIKLASFLIFGVSVFALAGCAKTTGCKHVDSDKDHACDLCGETLSEHDDKNMDHLCDICGERMSAHIDSNKDHLCDICGIKNSDHTDQNKDHLCDACGSKISDHVDIDENLICDICGRYVDDHAEHVDVNKDHLCDICGITICAHYDLDNDHKCDYCLSTISSHIDSDDNGVCDICGISGLLHIEGGTLDEQEAVQKATKMMIISASQSSGVSPEKTGTLYEDAGDFVYVVTSQTVKVNGINYTVKLEWTSDASNPYLSGYATVDDSHGIFEINYPGKFGVDGTISVKLSKISCGEAHCDNPRMIYNFEIKKGTYYHKDVHISDLLKTKLVDESKGLYGYDVVDYVTNPSMAYFTPNPENVGIEGKQYFCVNCFGKWIYNTPDGSWGIIVDGDNAMEVYGGSALNILPSRYPSINNRYVKVVGILGQYNGNMQLSFITEIKKAYPSDLEKGSLEPTFPRLTAEEVALYTKDGYQLQCINGQTLMNSLKSIKGKFVEGSVNGSVREGSRFTFQVDIGGGTKVTVAYDYHVDRYGDGVDTSSMQLVIDQLNQVMANPSQEFEIKGTLRYAGSNNTPFNQTSGEYQLVPYLANQITLA